jgi:hypothetical protein
LGHTILEEGVVVNPEKIKENMDWLAPQNVTKVRSFMGLARYYRMFINRFFKISHPITSMHRKGMKFVWSIECEANFQQLKHLLTNAPILKIAYPEKYFLACIDSFKEGLGWVLMQ